MTRKPRAFPAPKADEFDDVHLIHARENVNVRRPLKFAVLDDWTLYDIAEFENTATVKPGSEVAHILNQYWPFMEPSALSYTHAINEIYRELAWRLKELENELQHQQWERDF